MKDFIEGRHTGIPQCPICRETTFTKARNENATDTNLGRKKIVLKPISCKEHMRLAHPIDFERMQKLEEIKDMSFNEYIKSYSNPEKLSKKGTLFRDTQVLATVLGKDIVVEELSKDFTKIGRQKAFRPSEEDENKHHDECLAKALETEVIEELSKKASKKDSKKVPKSKIPNSVQEQ